ncbi:MAG: site-specific integrase [Halioglobus sp.]
MTIQRTLTRKYRVRLKYKGQRLTKTFDTEREAQQWSITQQDAIDLRLKALAELPEGATPEPDTPAPVVLTAATITDDYMSTYTRTNHARFNWWRYTFQHRDLPLESLTIQHMRQARADIAAKGIQPSTVAKYLSAWRVIFSAALNSDTLAMPAMIDPATGLKVEGGTSNVRNRCLSVDELRALRAAAPETKWVGFPVFFELGLATGARAGSLLALRWDDIDLDALTVNFKAEHQKTGQGYIQPLMPHMVPILRDWRQTNLFAQHVFWNPRKPHEAFRNYRTHWETARDIAGIEAGGHITWHDATRASAASFLAANGAGLLDIQAFLNHASPAMSGRYIRSADTIRENLRDKISLPM